MATKNYSNWVSKSKAAQRQLGGPTAFDGNVPPQFVLDRIADESLTGKFNVKRANLCGECFQYKSCNGECGCG